MPQRLQWITCDGGPHMLLAKELVPLWQGTDEPSRGRIVKAQFRYSGDPSAVATDYDAACDVVGLLGTVPVGDGFGLVLGDDVPMSVWIPAGPFGSGTLVITLAWPDVDAGDENLISAVADVSPALFTETGFDVSNTTNGFLHFAASDAQPWIYAIAEIPLPAGTYRVFTAEAEVHGFALRLHAFQRND